MEKEQSSLSAGEQKIQEYINRVENGESIDSFQLPPGMKSAVENGLKGKRTEEPSVNNEINLIPAQYEGLDSESLDFIWTIPEYMDPEKTKQEKERKSRALKSVRLQEEKLNKKENKDIAEKKQIETLREKLGAHSVLENSNVVESPKNNINKEELLLVSMEERKKLHGWTASYELAKIAKQQGIDLSKISREDYVEFAIKNSLAIDDDQLRVAPWQRMGTSVQEIVLANREKKAGIKEESEKAFTQFAFKTKEKAREEDRFISENIKVRQGTKDSDGWLFFGINNGTQSESKETFKSYVSVKDLNTLTPERFTQLMIVLRDAGYNGDIKIFQDLSEQGIRLNDQIVMHGGSEEDARLALDIAKGFFGSDLDQVSMGKDEVIDGKNMSYSQVLAKKISDAIK